MLKLQRQKIIGENKVEILQIICLLVLLIIGLIVFAVIQIRVAGLKIKDFFDFIQANQVLDSLYNVSKKYDKMSTNQQVVFLMEAEKVFNAFDKVPNMLWEDEYQKYTKIVDIYKEIRLSRWNEN